MTTTSVAGRSWSVTKCEVDRSRQQPYHNRNGHEHGTVGVDKRHSGGGCDLGSGMATNISRGSHCFADRIRQTDRRAFRRYEGVIVDRVHKSAKDRYAEACA